MSVNASTPRGRSTRAHSAIRRRLSEMCPQASRPIAASKHASGKGIAVASPCTKSTREQPGTARQPARRFDPALRQVQPGDAAADAVRDPARRAAKAAADVEHVVFAADPRQLDQRVDGAHAAVMVRVELGELILRRRVRVDAARGELGEDFLLVDRVQVW